MPARPRPLAAGTFVRALAALSALSLLASTRALSAQSAKVATLRRTLDSLSAAHRGVVGYSITNLETGEHLEQRGNETF